MSALGMRVIGKVSEVGGPSTSQVAGPSASTSGSDRSSRFKLSLKSTNMRKRKAENGRHLT